MAQPHNSEYDGQLAAALMSELVGGMPDGIPLEVLHSADLRCVQEAVRDLNSGDTLVLVNFPTDFERSVSCNSKRFYSQSFRMPSTVLRAMGLKKLPQLLDSVGYQRATARCNGYKKGLPRGIEYILDLSPSTDEEGGLSQLSHLSISEGVKRWYMASSCAKFPLSQNQYLTGHDDLCHCFTDYMSGSCPGTKKSDGAEGLDATERVEGQAVQATSIWELKELPRHRDIQDYCQTRHAANVIRLLRAMAGRPLFLDNAPRVFTLAGLGAMYEASDSEEAMWLREPLLEWFKRPSNCHILEILAEDSITAGYALKLRYVTRCAFAVLVGETALRDAGDQTDPFWRRNESVFGRRQGNVNDDIMNAVQHASRSLTERVKRTYDALLSPNAFTVLELQYWKRFAHNAGLLRAAFPDPAHPTRGAADDLEQELLTFMWRKVREAGAHVPTDESLNTSRRAFVALQDTVPIKDIYAHMTLEQRILTPPFWEQVHRIVSQKLSSYPFDADSRNLKKRAEAFNAAVNDCQARGAVDVSTNAMQRSVTAFDVGLFLKELVAKARALAVRLHKHDHLKLDGHRMPVTRHLLLAITGAEWQYLPTWAGGEDDGSGAVFEEGVPDVAAAFRDDGEVPATLAMGGMTLDERTEAASSMDVQDGHSTVYGRRRGIARAGSAASEQFSSGDDGELASARFAVPAGHQAQAGALLQLVEEEEDGDDGGAAEGRRPQEDGLSLFGGESDKDLDLAMDSASDSSDFTLV